MNIDFKFYLLIFFRRIHYFLLVFFIIAVAGISVAFLLPPVYQADALLLLEEPQISADLIESTVSADQSEQIQIIRQRLLTRSNLLDVAYRLNIYEDPRRMDPTKVFEDMQARTDILLAGGGRSGEPVNMLLRFSSMDPEKSAEVTNEFVTLVLQENADMRAAQVGGTLQFFEQEAARLGQDLDVKSSEILAFKMANSEALPDGLDFRRSRVLSQQQQLNQLRREISDLQGRRERMVEFFQQTGRLESDTQQLSPLERELQAARLERESALLTFSPQHPSIRNLDTRIATLEAQLQQQRGPSGKDMAPQSEFEFQLAEIDREIENRNTDVELFEAEIRELNAAIDATPANAITLSELERDYQNTQTLYSEVISRLAQAQTGERIEMTSRGQRITVLEQATIPTIPSSPPRVMIAVGSVFMGLVAGLGLVILLELFNRSIRRPQALVNALGITPLATIPYIRTDEQRRMRATIVSTAFIMAIIGIPVVLYVANMIFGPLDVMIFGVADKVGLSSLLGN